MAEFQHECEELGEEINEGIEALEDGVEAVEEGVDAVQSGVEQLISWTGGLLSFSSFLNPPNTDKDDAACARSSEDQRIMDESGVAAAKAAKRKVRKSDAAYQKEITQMEAEAKQTVKGLVEDALEEGVEALKEMLDEMEDELVPPLDMIVPFLSQCAPKFIQQCWRGLERVLQHAPALLHLVAIEFLPMWFFMLSVRAVFGAKFKDAFRVGGDYIEYVIDEETGETLFDNRGWTWMTQTIEFGAYLLVSALMLFIVISFCCRGLMLKRLSNSSYLKFSLDIKRSVTYRYLSGILYVCASLSLFALFILSGFRQDFPTLINGPLPAVFVAAFSMRSFIRPYRPKFSTVDAAFSELMFRRQFFEGSGGFSSRLSSALLQALRMPRAPLLRRMLCVAPENETEMVRQLRLVKQVCWRPSQPGKVGAIAEPPARSVSI